MLLTHAFTPLDREEIPTCKHPGAQLNAGTVFLCKFLSMQATFSRSECKFNQVTMHDMFSD